MLRKLAGFSHRLAWAIVFGLAGFFPCMVPLDDGPSRTVFHGLCYVFDLPVALVTRLGIPYVAGIDVYWFTGLGEYSPVATMLAWHMRLAVPLYLVLMYLPGWLLALARRRRAAQAPVAGV